MSEQVYDHNPGSGAGVLACLDRIRTDLATLNAAIAAGVLYELPEVVLPEAELTLLTVVDQAAAAASAVLARVHESGILHLDGHVSTRRWLQHDARLAEREATAMLARCRDLAGDFLTTRNAWLAGDITGGHTRAITLGLKPVLAKVPAADRDVNREAGEAFLLNLATDHTPDDVTRAATRLLAVVDTDGMTRSQSEDYDAQQFRLTPCGNGSVPSGFLDAEATATLATALDRIIDQMHHDGELVSEPVIDPATGQPLVEATRGVNKGRRHQWVALALSRLADSYLTDGKAGTSHGIPVHVNVHVDLADLRAGVGVGEIDVPGRDDPLLIPVSTVARLCCDARVTAILEEAVTTSPDPTRTQLVPPDGDLLSTAAAKLREEARGFAWLGREHRHVTPRLWRALVARDRHCQAPGCRAPVTRCRPHHVRPWSQGGTTDLDNLVLVCERHHRLVHEGGWGVTPTEGKTPYDYGYWTFNPPQTQP